MHRRKFLAIATAGVIAGCSGSETDGGSDGGSGTTGSDGGDGDGTGGDGDGTDGGDARTPVEDTGTRTPTATQGGTPSGTPSSDPQSLAGHPAAASLDTQPTLGPVPADATGVIIAFEDPSCPTCARFERTVVPEIRSNLVEPGDVSMVFRGYPVIYDWGQPAVRALESTYDRDADAFWSLVDHYFGNQRDFRSAGVDQVYPKTESFLADSTDLDAAAVVADAENGAFDGAVGTDLDAGKAAGAGRTTPHLFLFRDGGYRTKVQGSVSYSVIESALGI